MHDIQEEEEQEEGKRWTKFKFSCLVFSNLIKFSRLIEVDLALEYSIGM